MRIRRACLLFYVGRKSVGQIIGIKLYVHAVFLIPLMINIKLIRFTDAATEMIYDCWWSMEHDQYKTNSIGVCISFRRMLLI